MYKVGTVLGEGSFGVVYDAIDIKEIKPQKMVIKASKEIQIMFNEVQALEQIHKYGQTNDRFHKIIDSIPKCK